MDTWRTRFVEKLAAIAEANALEGYIIVNQFIMICIGISLDKVRTCRCEERVSQIKMCPNYVDTEAKADKELIIRHGNSVSYAK